MADIPAAKSRHLLGWAVAGDHVSGEGGGHQGASGPIVNRRPGSSRFTETVHRATTPRRNIGVEIHQRSAVQARVIRHLLATISPGLHLRQRRPRALLSLAPGW